MTTAAALSGYRKGEHSLLPWLPAARLKTEAPASVRIPPGATRRPTTFRLHFAGPDAPVATAIADALTRSGHAAAGPGEPAACDLSCSATRRPPR